MYIDFRNMTTLNAISLFSCGGIGDLAVRAAGFNIVLSNEISVERHAVYQANFPETFSVTGDIGANINSIVEFVGDHLHGQKLDLLFATPPCQGMSKNGRGKLLNSIRSGSKPEHDERNRLIIPTIEIAVRLQPEMILLENVPEMQNTVILDSDGEPTSILDFVQASLGQDYVGSAKVVEFADYGVPQCRQRLITVFSKHRRLKRWLANNGTLMPTATHSESGSRGLKKWESLRSAISDLPPLDAATREKATSDLPYHRVPTLDSSKYWWVSNTPAERSAFDNQCSECKEFENKPHRAQRDIFGVNRTSTLTPIHCEQCGSLLPRPIVFEDGNPRLMRGYTSAYKRMSYDKPASALTRNLSYACSDNKLHPVQNRVLSLLEAFRVHTVDHYPFEWKRVDGKKVSDKLVRELIGESIPPLGLQRIVDHLTAIYLGTAPPITQAKADGVFEFMLAE